MDKDTFFTLRDYLLDIWLGSYIKQKLISNWIVFTPYPIRRALRFGFDNLLFGLPALLIFLFLVLAKLMLRGRKIVFFRIQVRAIGHLAGETEMNLRRIINAGEKNIYIGFATAFTVCNRHLLNMFKRHITILDSIIMAKILGATFLNRTEFIVNNSFTDRTDRNYIDFKKLNKPVINFTPEEEMRGQQLLAEMGIKKSDWFVCFHSRDSAYHGSRYSGGFSHHAYRDSSIDNYLAAAEYIAERGGYAIRMGATVANPLPKLRHSRIVDYATEYRSDFMDIYLPARCKFFLGSTSGLFLISTIFGVPVANANYIPIDQTPYCAHDLFIPKKLWSIEKQRLLTFSEIFDSEIAHYNSFNEFAKAGIRPIENSSEEILGLAAEMYARLSGEVISEEELQVRRKYISLQRPHNCCYFAPPVICVDFLKKNLDLLNLEVTPQIWAG